MIVFAEEYLRLMLLALQEQANEHVDHARMMLMRNVGVYRSLMLSVVEEAVVDLLLLIVETMFRW